MKQGRNEQRRIVWGYRLSHTLIGYAVARLFRYERPRLPELKEPYLVIPNHTMELDFFLLMRSFSRPMDFVAGETLFRSTLLRWLFTRYHDPVIIRKGGSDTGATFEILRRLRAGRNVCLFAEGNTCFDGVTGPIPRGTGQLARASGAHLVTFRVGGCYLSAPRWGHGIRRGRTWGEVAKVYTPEDLKVMSLDEVNQAIARDLAMDALELQALRPVAYKGRRLAEGLGNALYLCPGCGAFDSLSGKGDLLGCARCGLSLRYTPYGRLEGEGGFETLSAWLAWQREQLRLKLNSPEGLTIEDGGQSLSLVNEDHSLSPVARGTLRMDARQLSLGESSFSLDSLAGLAIFRKNRLVLTTLEGKHFDIDSDMPRSALKYRDFFNIIRGRE